MFSLSADLYDAIYSWKDYASEAAAIKELIDQELPEASSLLDVACGTGEHIRHLLRLKPYDITGIDIEPGFVQIARSKNPQARFVAADMAEFELNTRFDVILCLFSAIGYLRTLDAVQRAIVQFARHVAPGGVILIEPWFSPDEWRPSTVHVISTEANDKKVVRMSRSDVNGRISTIDFHYLVGTVAEIRHFREIHELGLYTQAEMTACFEHAGLQVRYDDVGLAGRGLYIARPRV
jgi:ubiquinone/menaquinone biosynthesis C-methylase UbiE